jgi:valyl-tRNA synthetase
VQLLDYLTKLAPVKWSEDAAGDLAVMAPLVVGGTSIYLAATAAESTQVKARLHREHEQLVGLIASLEAKLDTQFAKMAPAAVVERERDRLEAASRREALLRKALRD